MLHDPRRDRTPSLAVFALFVASKPRDESYEWSNCNDCAVGQYLASIGVKIPLSEWNGIDALETANLLARGNPISSPRWTFGDLADRILAYQRAGARACS